LFLPVETAERPDALANDSLTSRNQAADSRAGGPWYSDCLNLLPALSPLSTNTELPATSRGCNS
jgi:hypothetical protein